MVLKEVFSEYWPRWLEPHTTDSEAAGDYCDSDVSVRCTSTRQGAAARRLLSTNMWGSVDTLRLYFSMQTGFTNHIKSRGDSERRIHYSRAETQQYILQPNAGYKRRYHPSQTRNNGNKELWRGVGWRQRLKGVPNRLPPMVQPRCTRSWQAD
jgi:hypothetical protein